MADDEGAYQGFLQTLQLESLALIRSRSARGSEIDGSIALNLSVKLATVVETDFFDVHFLVDVGPPDFPEESDWSDERIAKWRTYAISCHFAARYKFAPEKPQGNWNTFAEIFTTQNAFLHVWPFVREYVFSQARHMGILNGLMLPLVVPSPGEGGAKMASEDAPRS